LQLLLAGVAQGYVYALVALGFVLIYKATETVNFAQGDLMMLGAFFALTGSTTLGLPYWLTIVFALGVMAVFGMLAERLVLRPVLGGRLIECLSPLGGPVLRTQNEDAALANHSWPLRLAMVEGKIYVLR